LTTDTPVIEVTELASRKLVEVLAEQDKAGNMLRVMVMPGPGGALQYMLGVEDKVGDDDIVIETESVNVLIDSESVPLIEGASIDYVEGLMRSGFVISNPNAPAGGGGGCACGGGGGGGCGGGGGGGGCGCGGGAHGEEGHGQADAQPQAAQTGGGGCGGGGCGCGGG
jgi:iron-sulfur cluster assembly accessory protein